MTTNLTIAMPCTVAGEPVWFEDNTPSRIAIEYHVSTRRMKFLRFAGVSHAYREACERYRETIFALLSAGF
jgi:hypothetical protein